MSQPPDDQHSRRSLLKNLGLAGGGAALGMAVSGAWNNTSTNFQIFSARFGYTP
jgi:hypothetical protein